MKSNSDFFSEVIRLVPNLAGNSKVGIQLHPKEGPEAKVNATKLGGNFLWPKDEPWPMCNVPEVALIADYNWSAGLEDIDPTIGHNPKNIWPVSHPKHNRAYIGILQLRADEFPEMEFPHGKNLFQLLWCPRDHVRLFSPVCQVFWRDEGEVKDILLDPPAPEYPESDLIPEACRLETKRAIE